MAHSAVDIDTMDAGMPDGVPDFPEPKPQEAMFFFNIIKNMANQPDIDWDAVAADSGFKNAAVAKKRFYQIKQRLGLDSRPGAAAKTPSPRKPRVPKAAAAASAGSASASGAAAAADGEDKKPKIAKRRQLTTGAKAKAGRPASTHPLDVDSKELLDMEIDAPVGYLTIGFSKVKGEDGEDDEDDYI